MPLTDDLNCKIPKNIEEYQAVILSGSPFSVHQPDAPHPDLSKIKGKILANGGDWVLRLSSTTSKLDVRVVLETEDGDLIYTYYEGFIHMNSDGTYYFRTNPVFQTSSKKYSWLNHTIAIGVGKMIKGGVSYRIYAIK